MPRILVTGGSGFLGRHVVDKLCYSGYTVVRPSHADYNLTNQKEAELMFDNYDPDIVIHLAANVGGIGANQEQPADFLMDNAVMGLIMMDLARYNKIEKFVQIGTVCSYPKYCPVPFKEDDIWSGYPEETNAPYGLAKKLLLTYSQALRQQYGLNSIYLIPTNLYGPGDNFGDGSHVIPALINKIDAAIKLDIGVVDVWGSGIVTRDFLYVEDCAAAIVKAVEVYNQPEPINLGSSIECPIYSIAYAIADLMGFKGSFRFDLSKPDGQPRRCLDITRAKEKLDFSPQTDIMQGLKKTIDWYRSQR